MKWRGCYLLAGWCGVEGVSQVPDVGGHPEGGRPCQKASDHFTYEIRDGVYFPGRKKEIAIQREDHRAKETSFWFVF